MPFIDREGLGQTDIPDVGAWLGIGEEDTPNPSYMETVHAWMRTENIIGSSLAQKKRDYATEKYNEDVPGYKVFDHIEEKYKPYGDRFVHIPNNPIAVAATKADIDREIRDRETMAASGWIPWLTGLGLSQVTDPTILIPGGAFIRSGKIGYKAGKTALSIGAAALAGVGAQEVILYNTQQTRTLRESAINVGAGVAIGALLGGTASKLFSHVETEIFTKALAKELEGKPAKPVDAASAPPVKKPGLRAAYVKYKGKIYTGPTHEAAHKAAMDAIDDFIPSEKLEAEGYITYSGKRLAKDDPAASYEALAAGQVREDWRGFLEDQLKSGKEKVGLIADALDLTESRLIDDPLEVADTFVKRMQALGADRVEQVDISDLDVAGGVMAEAVARATAALKINPMLEMRQMRSLKAREAAGKLVEDVTYLKAHMEGRATGQAAESVMKEYTRGRLGKWITSSWENYKRAQAAGFEGKYPAYLAAVARAARRGDLDSGGNEFVSKAAREARELILDPLYEKAKALPLYKDLAGVRFAKSYLTRLWMREALIGREDDFRTLARSWFEHQARNMTEEQRAKYVSDADLQDHIEEAVDAVYRNLTGRGDGATPEWSVPPLKRGPLHERTFSIPDTYKVTTKDGRVISTEDFLENDMELILRRYTRTMAAEVELADKFHGDTNLEKTLADIDREYEELQKQAKTSAEKKSLFKEGKRAEEILTQWRDQLRGTHRLAEDSTNWSKITRAALAFNYMRLLGGVVLTSLVDMTRLVGVHGMRATMREALPALVSNLKAAKIARQDARDLGAVTEAVLLSRLSTLAELQDPYRYGSKFERTLSNATHAFSRATGLAWWNDTMKTIASVMTQNRMARTAMNWKGARKQDRAYMAMLGIDEDMSRRIAAQIEKHGVREKNIWGVNATEWDDEVARSAWAAALNKDVDRTIVTKGIGDTPLWMTSNWGKLIMQFKSFGLASHQKVLLAGLQNDQHRLAEMAVLATVGGMMISWAKYMERGDVDEAERLLDNPGLWIANGIDRSGVLFLLTEPGQLADKMGYPGFVGGMQALFGDEDRGGAASRWANRNPLGAAFGPSVGAFKDLNTVFSQLAQSGTGGKGPTEGDVNALIRLFPGLTLPIVRTIAHTSVKPWLYEQLD